MRTVYSASCLQVKFDISENKALGTGISTHLGSHGNGGGKSPSGKKNNSLEVVVGLFHVFQDRQQLYLLILFLS